MHLTEQALDLNNLLATSADDGSGALVVFGGTVRNENEGQSVRGMHYQAYAPLADKALAELEAEALQRFDIRRCQIIHRSGELQLGELSVLVVVRAAHRAAAFDAARWAIDTLKQRVPVWKQEHYASGASSYLEGTPIKHA